MRHFLCALTLVAVVRLAAADAPPPASIPIETFFAEPDFRSVQLSPDGNYISFL